MIFGKYRQQTNKEDRVSQIWYHALFKSLATKKVVLKKGLMREHATISKLCKIPNEYVVIT